jgi:hypothetical protein
MQVLDSVPVRSPAMLEAIGRQMYITVLITLIGQIDIARHLTKKESCFFILILSQHP